MNIENSTPSFNGFSPNLMLAAVALSSKTMEFHKKEIALLSEHVWDLKLSYLKEKEKMHCSCSAAIYVNVPHHLCSHRPLRSLCTRWCWPYSEGARSCFRWKLHPSSQAWPLLSTSNRGKTVIAKCGNSTTLTDARETANASNGCYNVNVICAQKFPGQLGLYLWVYIRWRI